MRVCCLVVSAVLLAASAARAETPTSLDYGYRLMYGLDFASAGQVFDTWRAEHPRDPLGPISEAANLFFSELDRLGILQSQFFVDDASFTARKLSAAPHGLRERFGAAIADAEVLSGSRLREDPRDRDALFTLAMVYGLRADYAALIEGRSLASLAYAREATRAAGALLDVAPDCADAYLASGVSQYIVGSLVAPLRWILRAAGYRGDKARGMEDMRLTAERGRFLGPFARILLTIAYLREHDTARARELLVGLEREFPSNPLFARELRRTGGIAN